MKTIKLNMAGLFLVLGLLLISSYSNAQDLKLTRKERKEVRKAQMNANFHILDSLLNARSFVLEADFLQDKYGMRVPVISNVNFIRVDQFKSVLQTGTGTGFGYNGVGGVTAEGKINSWNIHKNAKELSYTLRVTVMTQIGTYDVLMTVNSENNASAIVTGLWPGKLTWVGHLYTLNNSRVFKGQNTI